MESRSKKSRLRSNAARRPCSFRPQVEYLESRLPPGDLGFAAWVWPAWVQGLSPADLLTRTSADASSRAAAARPEGSAAELPGATGCGSGAAAKAEPPQTQQTTGSVWQPHASWAAGGIVPFVSGQERALEDVLNRAFSDPAGPGLRPASAQEDHSDAPARGGKGGTHDGHASPAGCGCHCGCDCGCAAVPLPANLPPPQLPRPEPPATRGLQVRKNQADLSPAEIQAFVDTVKQLKNTFRVGMDISVYDEYVQAHILAMSDYSAHDGPAFLPWHRALVRSFEVALQTINPSVTVPYWDFTVDNSTKSSLWSDAFLGGTGDPKDYYIVKTGPFRQGEWVPVFDGPELHRHLGGWLRINLPTPEDVAGALRVPRYDVPPYDPSSNVELSFRNYVAGWSHLSGEAEMHNRVHEWVAGSMMNQASPNDPVFWLLHANIDRIWGQWQDLGGAEYEQDAVGREYQPVQGGPDGHNLYDVMPFVGVTPADVLDYRALGYVYAS